MRLAGLIFDLDGTLIDNEVGDCASFIRAFAEFGHPGLTPNDVKSMFGPSADGIIQALLGDGWEACWQVYFRYYMEELATLEPPEGVMALLDGVREAQMRLGLVTGKGVTEAELTLERLGIDCFGSFARYGSTGGSVKRESIRDMLAEWGAEPNLVAYVGDAAGDMRIAKDVGVVPLGAAWCSTADAKLLEDAGAVAVFKSPDELRAWVLDWDRRLGHP